MGVDVVGDLNAGSFLEKLEHYHSGRESLDKGGTDYATGVAKTYLVMNRLLDGSSRGKYASALQYRFY
jgi:hypothetical protein